MLNSVMESSLLEHDEFLLSSTAATRNDASSVASVINNRNNNNNNNITSSSTTTNRARTRTYPIVEVVAPETLSEGYTFDVEVNHEILSVVVVSF
jgi:hypothetical protein